MPSASAGSDLSTLRRVWYSLLGGHTYRRVAEDPTRTYAAFLLVAAATATVIAGVGAWSAHRALSSIVATWPRLPAFSVNAGHLELPPGTATPVRVAGDGAVVVLEPQSAGEDPLGRATVGLFVTGEEVVVRPGRLAGADRHIPVSAFGGVPVTKAGLGQLLWTLAGPGVWVGAVLGIALDLARDFARAAVTAWMGLVLVRLRGRITSWPEAWRIGLAAWTLPMIAEAAGVIVPVPAWALWLVASVYVLTGCTQLEGD